MSSARALLPYFHRIVFSRTGRTSGRSALLSFRFCIDSTIIVRTIKCVKRNVTLSAEERMITAARQRAAAEGTSLNRLFRRWIESYAQPSGSKKSYAALMERLSHVNPGRSFDRDEMNER